MTTSYSSKSETKGVNAVDIACEELGTSYVICDSAGLFDTGGAEVELANGVVMIDAIRSCRSVKVVFVLTPGQVGAKLRELRNGFVNYVKRLLVDLPSQVGSCYYLFNRYSTDPMSDSSFGSMSDSLEQFPNCMNEAERADDQFMAVITDMISQLHAYEKHEEDDGGERPRFRRVDLLDNNRKDFLLDFDAMPAIADPSRSFRVCVGEAVVSTLKEQCGAHVGAIRKAVRRQDYAFVRYKLIQLKLLHVSLSVFPECRFSYREGVDLVFEHIRHIYGCVVRDVEKCLEDRQDNRYLLAAFVARLGGFFQLGTIRVEHVAADGGGGRDIRAVVCSRMLHVLKHLCGQVLQWFRNPTGGIVPSTVGSHRPLSATAAHLPNAVQLSTRLLNWRFFHNSLPALRDTFPSPDDPCRAQTAQLMAESAEALDATEGQMKGFVAELRSAFDDSPSRTGSQRFSKSLTILREFTAIRPFAAFLPDVDEAFAGALGAFESCIAADCADVLKKLTGKKPTAMALKASVEITNSVFGMLRDGIDVLPTEVVARISTSVQPIMDSIGGMCDAAAADASSSDGAFTSINERLRVVDALRAVPEVCQPTQDAYFALMMALRSAVSRVKDQALKLLAADTYAPDSLSRSLVGLQEAACFRDRPEELYKFELKDVVGHMAKLSEPLVDDLARPVSFKQHSDVKQMLKPFAAVKRLVDATQTIALTAAGDFGAQLRNDQARWSDALAKFTAAVAEAFACAVSAVDAFVEPPTTAPPTTEPTPLPTETPTTEPLQTEPAPTEPPPMELAAGSPPVPVVDASVEPPTTEPPTAEPTPLPTEPAATEPPTPVTVWPAPWLPSLRGAGSLDAQDSLRTALQFVSMAESFKPIDGSLDGMQLMGKMTSTLGRMRVRLTQLVSDVRDARDGRAAFGEAGAEELKARLDYLRLLACVPRGEGAESSSLLGLLRDQASAILQGQVTNGDSGVMGALEAFLGEVDKEVGLKSETARKFVLFALCQLLSPGNNIPQFSTFVKFPLFCSFTISRHSPLP